MRQHTHPGAHKGVVNRVGDPRRTKRAFNINMLQKIDSATKRHPCITFSSQTARLPLLNERTRTHIHSVSNRRRFTVVERSTRGTNHEILEVNQALRAELHNLDQARLDELDELGCILTTFAQAAFDFVNHYINDHHAMGQRLEKALGAARCVDVDHNTCVGDQERWLIR